MLFERFLMSLEHRIFSEIGFKLVVVNFVALLEFSKGVLV
jgi:hypothetical protein